LVLKYLHSSDFVSAQLFRQARNASAVLLARIKEVEGQSVAQAMGAEAYEIRLAMEQDGIYPLVI